MFNVWNMKYEAGATVFLATNFWAALPLVFSLPPAKPVQKEE
jgi:hypothetical protein